MQRATPRCESRRWREHPPAALRASSGSPFAPDAPPVQSVADAGLREHPGDETVAVRAGPVAIAPAMRINLRLGEHGGDALGLFAGPHGGDARPSAADICVRRLQIAVHVTVARAAR